MGLMTFKLTLTTDGGSTSITQDLTEESVITRLNRIAAQCGYSNIARHAIEDIGWEGRTSTTALFNRNPDASILLNTIIAGTIRDYNRPGIYQVPSDFIGQVGIHRAMISYSAASRIKNVESMVRTMSHILNLGVKDLINQFGYEVTLPGYRITMEMPGYEGIFFRDCDHAAFEVRLLLIKE